MKYKDYKHCLIKPDTHKELTLFKVNKGFKSIDFSIKTLLSFYEENFPLLK